MRVELLNAALSSSSIVNRDFRLSRIITRSGMALDVRLDYILLLSAAIAFLIFVIWRMDRTGFAIMMQFCRISLEIVILFVSSHIRHVTTC